jgi:hypothetical protein
MFVANNTFYEIGYLSTTKTKIPFNNITNKFNYADGTTAEFQQVGIFRFLSNVLDKKEMSYTFKNNRFRKIFGSDTGIYSIDESHFLKDIRFKFIGNYYHQVFCNTASILNINNKFDISP